MASSSGTDTKNDAANAATDEMSIEDLQKEIEVLKRRIIDERNKLCDKTVVQVAEAIDMVQGLNVKVRRSLKGHNAKVLCLDWSTDKRHLVSSSQASILVLEAFFQNRKKALCSRNFQNVKFRRGQG